MHAQTYIKFKIDTSMPNFDVHYSHFCVLCI